MNPLRREGKGLEFVGYKHARRVECCDLRCTRGSVRLVKGRERLVSNQEPGHGDQRGRRRRLRSLPSTQAIHVPLTRVVRESSSRNFGTHLFMDERCGNSAALQRERQIINEARERVARRRPSQDDADLFEQRCGRARFTRGSRGNKVNPAHAKRPLQFTRYEGAEKSGACCGERALSGSRCATDQERLTTS
jgi:hypothetical protein